MTSPVEPFRRQAFEMVREPRWPFVAQLVRMIGDMQTGVLESLIPLYRMPFVRGLEAQAGPLAAAGTFSVKHRLKRVPRGWLVLDVERAAAATGDLAIYRRAADTRDESVLVLYGSASFESLTLWVW